MTTPPLGDCWPTPDQTLLLRAALLPGEAAREAWVAWRQRASLAELDGGSRRLLPVRVADRGVRDDDDFLAVVTFDANVAGEQIDLESRRPRRIAERYDETLVVLRPRDS